MEILVQEDALASLMTEDLSVHVRESRLWSRSFITNGWRKSNRICICTSKSGSCPVCLPVIC